MACGASAGGALPATAATAREEVSQTAAAVVAIAKGSEMLRKIFGLAVALVIGALASPAVAQKASISELNELAKSVSGAALPMMPTPVAQQSVDFSGGPTSSSAFGAGTRFIRVSCSVRCS